MEIKRKSIDLTSKQHYRLSIMAVKSRISLKKFIENIIEDYLNQKNHAKTPDQKRPDSN